MGIIGEWFRRLAYLLRRRAMEDELRREMESHRAMMDDPRAFGNTLRLRDEARDAWGWRWLDDLAQDMRFAWRTLRRSPGFTLTAIVTLAFGIGVNIGMFRLVNGLLLRPLYERPEQVIGVSSRSTKPDGGGRGLSYPNYLDLREGTTERLCRSVSGVDPLRRSGRRRGASTHHGVRGDGQLLRCLRRAAGAWTSVHQRGGAARRQYPCRHHQPSTLAATRGRRDDHRTHGTRQRRTVHHSRRRRRGIYGDLYSRTGVVAATRRSRHPQYGASVGDARAERTRCARVDRRRARARRCAGRERRAGSWPRSRDVSNNRSRT